MPVEIKNCPTGIVALGEGEIAKTGHDKGITFTALTSCIGVIFEKGVVKIAAHFVEDTEKMIHYGDMISTINGVVDNTWSLTIVCSSFDEDSMLYLAGHITGILLRNKALAAQLCTLIRCDINLNDAKINTEIGRLVANPDDSMVLVNVNGNVTRNVSSQLNGLAAKPNLIKQ